MRLARRAGLEVAPVEIGTAGETKFLQVERFDRLKLADGRWERIHQEDFCQALGIPPELKYQEEGGPNLKKCFELVRAVSAVPGPDVLRLFDAVVFNYLVGNSDAHGKNFSFLYDGVGAKFAPLYDLVCTQAYENLAPDMAMKIGDERKPKRIGPRNWHKFFKDAGIGHSPAERRLLALAKRIQQETKAMIEENHAGAESVSPVVLRSAGICSRNNGASESHLPLLTFKNQGTNANGLLAPREVFAWRVCRAFWQVSDMATGRYTPAR